MSEGLFIYSGEGEKGICDLFMEEYSVSAAVPMPASEEFASAINKAPYLWFNYDKYGSYSDILSSADNWKIYYMFVFPCRVGGTVRRICLWIKTGLFKELPASVFDEERFRPELFEREARKAMNGQSQNFVQNSF